MKVPSAKVEAAIRRSLSYDPATGHLTWIKPGSFRFGARAGYLKHRGYRMVVVAGAWLAEHRVAWFLVKGNWPADTIDHINRIKTDNRWENLRLATAAEQAGNISISRRNTSGHRGVSWSKRESKWRVTLRRKELGVYVDKEQAIAVYNEHAKRHYGEFYDPSSARAVN